MHKLYLSRRNLVTLLNKLDAKKRGEHTFCTLIKNDTVHPRFPATIGPIAVTAVEDEEYYTERDPGEVKVF